MTILENRHSKNNDNTNKQQWQKKTTKIGGNGNNFRKCQYLKTTIICKMTESGKMTVCEYNRNLCK